VIEPPKPAEAVIVYWLTTNGLLIPVWLEPDVEMVTTDPGLVNVTCPDQTPAWNAVVDIGLIVPVESLKVFDPV
jgi:hypothetical protein